MNEKRLIARWWISLYLSLLVFSCCSNLSANSFIIEGTVATAKGKPIAKVEVELKNDVFITSTTTDKDGRFLFDEILPRTYTVTAQKRGWALTSQHVSVVDEPLEIQLEMELTPVNKLINTLRYGSLAYVLIFGLLIFVANFFIAPKPATAVTVFGWGVVLFTISIAWAKADWEQAIVLTVLGIGIALVIQRKGGKAAKERTIFETEQRQAEQETREQEQESIQSLVGKSGVAVTDLKACGTVDVDGKVVTGRALRGFIPQKSPIVVRTVEGSTLVVDQA